jgi:uncharacterized protein with LGFP repeats
MARTVPAHGEHAGKAVRYLSPTVEAPHEFDLVGLAGEIRQIELRVRGGDGEWSPWTDVEGGDPLYTGGSEVVQVRSRSFRPSGELHFVNVSGTSGGLADRLVNSARGSIHDAFVSAAGSPVVAAVVPGLADAARKPPRKPPLPPVVSRAAWGADNAGSGCPPRAGPVMGTVGAAVIHHTVSTVDYTPEEAPGIVLGICRYHVFGNGWNDIGYNALVDRFGNLYEGRAGGLAAPIVGAHTEGYNSQTTGVASIGDHTQAPLEPAAMSTLVRYLAWKFAVAAIPATGTTTLVSAGGTTTRNPSGVPVLLGRIFGHGTTNLTECPGPLLDALIPAIRHQVQARIKKFAGKRGKKKHRHRRHHR